jgi:ABC-2 type transport system permease protein
MSGSLSAATVGPHLLTAIVVEAIKLRRSLALWLAGIAPALVAVFVFANLLRADDAPQWQLSVRGAAGIWAFFMLPMAVTALTTLVAHLEHGPRAWDTLRALPRPRWHLPAAKAIVVLAVVGLMHGLLAVAAVVAIEAAAWLVPAVAPAGPRDVAGFAALLGRVYLSAWLLVAVQLWVALRWASFVPALVLGIAGTFFAVVATSAEIGVFLPWQIPVNQLAADPLRGAMALVVGAVGGCIALGLMLRCLARTEMP